MAVRRNILANYAGQAWAAIMGLAFLPVYIDFLGMEAYGLIGVFAVLQTWLSLLDFGLTPTLTREMAKPRVDGESAGALRTTLRSVELVVAAIACLAACAIGAASPWIAKYWLNAEHLSSQTVAGACALMGVVIALRGVENVYRGSIVGLERQVALNVATSALATLRAAGAVFILAFVSPTITAFFLWQAVVSLATVGVFAAIVYRTLPAGIGSTRFSMKSLVAIRRFSAGTFGISLLGFLLSQTDKLVLSRELSLAEFGSYSLAATLAAYVRLLATSIDQAVYPRLVGLYASGNQLELARLYHKVTQLSAVLMGGVGISMIMFGREFVAGWTGNPALAADIAPLLALLTIGMVANGLMNGPYYLQMAAGWTSLLLRSNIIMAIGFVPLIITSVHYYGAFGAATVWAAINLLYLVVIVSLMHRRLLRGEQRRWYVEDILLPLGSATIAAAAFRMIIPVYESQLLSGAVFIAGGAIALIAAAAASSHVRTLALNFIQGPASA